MGKFKNKEAAAVLILLIVSLLAEIFLFNFRYFEEKASGAPYKKIDASDFLYSGGSRTADGIKNTGGSSFSVFPGVAVNSLAIHTDSGGAFTVAVAYKDESSSKSEINAGEWSIRQDTPGGNRVRFISGGRCGEIRLTPLSSYADVKITSIELNCPYFHFSVSRFLFLFLALLILHRLLKPRIWDNDYKADDFHRRESVLVIFMAAVIFAAFLYTGYNDISLFTSNVRGETDCYRLLTDALYHGQLHFVTEPPAALKALANPYDPSAREGIDYIFDSAYFGGHYYCYFGVAPVITLLLPFRILTGVYMPTSLACLIYMLFLLLAALLFYYNIAAKWFPEIGYLPFIGGAAAVAFGANLFWLIARPTFYELAVTSALCWLFAGFSLLLAASRGVRPALLLCLSGLCFALTVASRPTYVFYLLAAVPVLLPLIFKGKSIKTFALKPAVAFFAPLAVFAVLLMVYNGARFGSPFDFGQKYQLTVSDVRFNRLTNLAAIPGGIFHYFFAPLSVDLTFPFFHIVKSSLQTSSGYYYNQPMAGLFNFPLLLILPAAPYIIRRMDKKGPKVFVSVLILCGLLLTYLNITIAGVLERYTLDIGPMLLFACVIFWFEALGYFRRKGAGRPMIKFFFTVCIVTAIISILCSSIGENDIQAQTNPRLFQTVSSLFEFWR